jgi:response regulator of citrate/malate metabolism
MASGVNLQKALAATEAAGKVLAAKAELTKKQKALREQTGLNKKELKERLKALDEEYEAKLKLEEGLDEETRKLAEKRIEDEAKETAAQMQKAYSSAVDGFKNTKIFDFKGRGKQKAELKEQG